MRERGWCEAGVTKPGREDTGRASGPMEAFGLDRHGGISGQGSDADGGVGAGWTRRSVGPDEWCLRRGERL